MAKTPKSIIPSENLEKDPGQRWLELFHKSAAVHNEIGNFTERLSDWIADIETTKESVENIKSMLSGTQAEMFVALSKALEGNELLISIIDDIVNGLSLWQNRKLLQSVDTDALIAILKIMEPETIEQAFRKSDIESRRKIREAIKKAILKLESED